MAPEQLEGSDVDARADLFAFGAVLYEMLTGRKAFEGKTGASLISAILTSEAPPVSSIESMATPLVDRVVERCLAKDPEDRWHSAHDLAAELGWLAEGGSGELPQVATSSTGLAKLIGVGVAAALAGAALVWGVLGSDETAPAPLRRFTVDLGTTRSLPVFGTSASPALSPDGKFLAYSADVDGVRVFLRPLDAVEALPIPNSENGFAPFFSPDGEWLAFLTFAERTLEKVSVRGGTPQVLTETQRTSGGTWLPDGTIIFSSGPNTKATPVACAGNRGSSRGKPRGARRSRPAPTSLELYRGVSRERPPKKWTTARRREGPHAPSLAF